MILLTDQLAREAALDTSKSFIVQAPAGSGKTSLLTQRFLKLLLSVAQPEQVLALTFTKKASIEMRDRVLRELLQGESALAQQVSAHAARNNWQILENPNRIKIQTFDALCAFIVSKRPFLSGFGASMNVSKSVEHLYQNSVSNLMQKVKDLPAYQADFQCVFSHFDNDRNRLAQLLESLLATRQQWLSLVLDLKAHAAIESSQLAAYLNSKLQDVRENFISEAQDCVRSFVPDALARILEIARGAALLNNTPGTLSCADLLVLRDLLLTKDGALRKTITIAQKIERREHKQELIKILQSLNDSAVDVTGLHALAKIVPENYSEQQLKVLLALINVLLLLVAEFDLQACEKNEVDFVQIAIAASNALGHLEAPSELALELDYNLQHILVDEFQDTSQAQFEVLQQLTNSWDDYGTKTIFFVGDPMQSIYKFRQANVSIFLQVKEYGFNNLRVDFLALTTNFRATKLLVDWTNVVCSSFFPQVDNYHLGAVSFASSQAHIEHTEASCVQGFFVNDQARQIIKLVRQQHTGTIAILVRARTHLPQIIHSLNNANLAYSGVDIGLLLDKVIVQDLLTITRALLDFSDQIAWLALLRLPWIGLSYSDIQLIVNHGKTTLGTIITGCELSPDGLQRLKLVQPIILQAYFNKTNLTVSSLVRLVFNNLTANLKISKAEIFEVNAYLNFLSQLEVEYTTLNTEIINSRLESLYINYGNQDQSLVQVMTIHKAKGLEFDTVIIPYLHKYPQSSEAALIMFDQQLIAQIKDSSEQSEPIYKYLFEKNAAQNNLEAKRLFYVALTRAKQKIYLLSEKSEGKHPHKNSFLSFIGGFTQNFLTIEDDPAAHVAQSLIYQRLPQALLNSQPQGLSNNPVSGELRPVSYFDPNPMRLAGIALHQILCYVANIGIENIVSHEVFIPYIQQSLVSKTYQKLAVLALAQVFANKLAREILSNKHLEAYSEWPIMTNFKGILSKNILDRAYLDHAGTLWIVDYKFCHEHDLATKLTEFSKQLQRYLRCVVNLKKYAKVKALIYLLLQDRFIEVSLHSGAVVAVSAE